MDGTVCKIETDVRLAQALPVPDEEYRFGLSLDFVASLPDEDVAAVLERELDRRVPKKHSRTRPKPVRQAARSGVSQTQGVGTRARPPGRSGRTGVGCGCKRLRRSIGQ